MNIDYGAGAAAITGFTKGMQIRRQTQQFELQQRQSAQTMEMQKMSHGAQMEQYELQMQKMNMEMTKMKSEKTKQDFYSSWDEGSVIKLNEAINSSDQARKLFGVQNIDFFPLEPNDWQKSEVKRLKIKKIEDAFIGTQILPDGTAKQIVFDMNKKKIGSGYKSYKQEKEYKVQEQQLRTDKLRLDIKKIEAQTAKAKITTAPTLKDVKAQEFQTWQAKPENKGKTTADYEAEIAGKKAPTTITEVANKVAEYEAKISQGIELSPLDESRHTIYKKRLEDKTDATEAAANEWEEVVGKYYNVDIFTDIDSIDKADILKLNKLNKILGIKPDAKGTREYKDQYTTLEQGIRLNEDIQALNDEEISRGMVDSGLNKIKKMFSDGSFEKLSDEEKKKTMTSIKTNTKLGMFLAKYIKSISGTAVAEAEFNRLTALFSGSNWENTQALKSGVSEFVSELDKEFVSKSKVNLLGNPTTTLDLVKRYKNLKRDKPVTEIPTVTKQYKQTATNPSTGEKMGLTDSGWEIIK